jgi:hypothetical protein
MTEFNADSMHRLAKMALDLGEVASPEEAIALFSRYRMRIHLGHGWAHTLAGQACFLTALNTAVRAFLGGVEVYGDLGFTVDVPLYQGRGARDVAEELGAVVVNHSKTELPTLVLGVAPEGTLPAFCVQLSWDHWRFEIAPADTGGGLTCADDNPLAGIGAAALGLWGSTRHSCTFAATWPRPATAASACPYGTRWPSPTGATTRTRAPRSPTCRSPCGW